MKCKLDLIYRTGLAMRCLVSQDGLHIYTTLAKLDIE